MQRHPPRWPLGWIISLGVLLTVSAASAQPCCECRCPGNESRACSGDFGLDDDAYLAAVCEPLGCSVAVCTNRACSQSNRCPQTEDGRCGDGADNDADGLFDCDDPDCAGSEACMGGGGDCCEEHTGIGCDVPACEACVCSDAFCCEDSWDSTCAMQANGRCAEVCACGGLPTPTPPTPAPPTTPPVQATPTGDAPTPSDGTATPTVEPLDCCVALEVAGCGGSTCESCVCGTDLFCCDSTWDVQCADIANTSCAEACECEIVTTPTSTPTPAPPSNCCMERDAEDGPGCSLPSCESCVCNVDDFCCADFWDQTCAEIASSGCLPDCGCVIPPTVPSSTPTRTRAPRSPGPPPTPECTTSENCPAGFLCNAAGRCVAPSPTPDGNQNGGGGDGGGGDDDDQGCTLQTETKERGSLVWLMLPLLIAIVARRWR